MSIYISNIFNKNVTLHFNVYLLFFPQLNRLKQLPVTDFWDKFQMVNAMENFKNYFFGLDFRINPLVFLCLPSLQGNQFK